MPKRHTPMPGKVKLSFNREGNGDRHYALTRIVMTNGYYVVVNDRLCPGLSTAKGLRHRETLGCPYQ